MEETWTKQDSLDIWCYSNFSSSWMWERILHAICKAVKSSGQDWVPVQVAQPCTAWQGLIPFEQSWILLMFPTASVLWHCFAHGVLLACMHQYAYNAYNMYMRCYEITSDTVGGVKHVKFIPITPRQCWTRICKSPLNFHPQGKNSTNVLPSTKKAHSLCECLFTRSIWLSYKSPWAKEARFHTMATTFAAGSENWQPCLRWRSFIWSHAWGMWFCFKRSPAHMCRSASMRCESILLLKAKMQVFEHICCVPVARMHGRPYICIEVGQNDVG